VEDEVLGPDAGGERIRDLDPDRPRHFDVERHPERPDARHLGGADAEGEGPSAPWLVVCESVPTTTAPGRT